MAVLLLGDRPQCAAAMCAHDWSAIGTCLRQPGVPKLVSERGPAEREAVDRRGTGVDASARGQQRHSDLLQSSADGWPCPLGRCGTHRAPPDDVDHEVHVAESVVCRDGSRPVLDERDPDRDSPSAVTTHKPVTPTGIRGRAEQLGSPSVVEGLCTSGRHERMQCAVHGGQADTFSRRAHGQMQRLSADESVRFRECLEHSSLLRRLVASPVS
jgi:hypothetical protein